MPNQIHRVWRMGERLGEFMRSRRDGVGQDLCSTSSMLRPQAVQAMDVLFAVGPAYGQPIVTLVTVLNDGTDGLMGSLDVWGGPLLLDHRGRLLR